MANGGTANSNGISYEIYLAQNCLIGSTSFPAEGSTLKFHDLKVDLKGYEEWLRLGTIETSRTRTRITTKYKAPKDITYDIDDGKLSICYDISGPHFGLRRGSSLTLTEEVSLSYKPRKFASLEEMKTQFGLIADLFILLTGSDYRPTWPLLSYGREKRHCQFYFPRLRSSASPPRWHDCWTNLPLLRDNFGQIFSAWKKKREEFGPGFYLYLGTRRGAKLYVEHRFVNLIWGIESLHRRKTPKTETPNNLKKKIERILVQIKGGKDKRWLERLLIHSDEPSLEERIFDIFRNLPIGLEKMALRQFSKHCAQTRNDISHFGGQRHQGSYWEFVRETDKKNDALSYLYHILLLQEIGIDGDILNSWVHKSPMSYAIKTAFAEVGLLEMPQ